METLRINLIEKYKDSNIEHEFNYFKNKVAGFANENAQYKLKTGEVISFKGGLDNNIEFTSKILGFNSEGNAFVLWDCYWLPVNLRTRLI